MKKNAAKKIPLTAQAVWVERYRHGGGVARGLVLRGETVIDRTELFHGADALVAARDAANRNIASRGQR